MIMEIKPWNCFQAVKLLVANLEDLYTLLGWTWEYKFLNTYKPLNPISPFANILDTLDISKRKFLKNNLKIASYQVRP